MWIKFQCDDDKTGEFIKGIMMLATLNGTYVRGMEATLDKIVMPEMPGKRGRKGPRVEYFVIDRDTYAETLKLIGENNQQGVVFKFLYQNGPCTEKHIRETTTWSRKAIESIVDKLKDKGVVGVRPIAQQEQPQQEVKDGDAANSNA